MGTMAGINPRPSDFREGEVEPVYMLTRRRSSVPPPPASSPNAAAAMPMAVPQPTAVDVARRAAEIQSDEVWDDQPWGEDTDGDEDFSDVRLVRRFTRRRRAIRVLGVFAILGTLAGGTYVLQQPKVRHEALSFVTMGHEDAAVRLGHRIAAIANQLRGR